jgi:nucleotide-binding universal stress UspA family protein
MSGVAQIREQDQHAGFKRVLVATDFSAASERALAYSLPIVRRYRSELSIVHAIPSEVPATITWDPLPRELDRQRLEAEEELGRLANEARIKDLNPHLVLLQGPAWDVISSIIRRENTDLLVLGTHGRGGLKKLALGSVAEEVLRQAPCPVLTVGPNVPPVNDGKVKFGTILMATDFGPAADRALAYALFLAEDYQAKLILVHMVPPMPVSDMGPGAYCPGVYAAKELTEWQTMVTEESGRKLRQLVPSAAKLTSQPTYVVRTGFLPEGVLATAAAHDVNLIVMGANRKPTPRMSARLPWALTHNVICEARCPVLTVTG